jgi:hypothetical protein
MKKKTTVLQKNGHPSNFQLGGNKEVIVKVPRTRAWRRRKSRVITKIRQTKDWLVSQFENREKRTKAREELKQHQHGKLTKRQELRTQWLLREDLAEG